MELLSMDFLTALMTIVVIDLVLAGDNAILIGLAARKPYRRESTEIKLFYVGSLGAIVIRAIATMAVVWLLKVPGYKLLVGGVLLVMDRIQFT